MYLCRMKKILLSLLAIVSFTVSAQDTKSFTPQNWVTDNGNFYTPAQEVELNKIISDYEKKTSIEIGVITIKSLGDTSIEEYADKQFNRIGIGKKGADNGLLIVFSMDDRASRIETGNGMEPFFTDADAYDALEFVKPSFRAGNYAEGTTNCINFITKTLGGSTFATKVKLLEQKKEWERQRKAKQDKEDAIAHAAFMNGLTNFLIGAAIVGIFVLIYFIDRQRRRKIAEEKERARLEELRKERVKKDILDNIDTIKSITVDDVSFSNSKVLKIRHESVKQKLDVSIKSINTLNNDDDDVYLNSLKSLKSSITDEVRSFNRLNSDYKDNVSSISRLEGLVSDARFTNKRALADLEKIKSYGYSKSYTDISNYLDTLSEDVVAIKNLLDTDVDKAIEQSKDFKDNLSYSVRDSRAVSNYLIEIESAKSKLSAADTTIQSAMSDITRYKGYLRSGELDKVEKEYEDFRKKTSSSSDYLALALIFATLLASIASLVSTLRRRKSDEEEEERREKQRKDDEDRRRRDSYYSSSSSSSSSWSSSSDSGSSFGGFGGGGSSGGGASSGW
jgi:uncharacterized membrane protein YgcG